MKMKKEKFLKVVLLSALIGFAFNVKLSFARLLDIMKGEQERLESRADTVQEQEKEEYDKSIEEQVARSQQSLDYTSSKLRDPFTLTVPQEALAVKTTGPSPLPAFKIDGFVWGSSLPQAIINNKVYAVGDTVEGAQIIKIDKDGITFLFQDNVYTVR